MHAWALLAAAREVVPARAQMATTLGFHIVLACFGIAFFCRLVDRTPYGDLPMGTHWLWHTFGAISTALIIEYFYKVESEGLTPTGKPAAGE